MMSNGYKPMPLELSEVKLSPAQELLVDKLAENAHNVWAKDRVKQGWTYGIQQVMKPSVQVDVLIWCFHFIVDIYLLNNQPLIFFMVWALGLHVTRLKETTRSILIIIPPINIFKIVKNFTGLWCNIRDKK